MNTVVIFECIFSDNNFIMWTKYMYGGGYESIFWFNAVFSLDAHIIQMIKMSFACQFLHWSSIQLRLTNY